MIVPKNIHKTSYLCHRAKTNPILNYLNLEVESHNFKNLSQQSRMISYVSSPSQPYNVVGLTFKNLVSISCFILVITWRRNKRNNVLDPASLSTLGTVGNNSLTN